MNLVIVGAHNVLCPYNDQDILLNRVIWSNHTVLLLAPCKE